MIILFDLQIHFPKSKFLWGKSDLLSEKIWPHVQTTKLDLEFRIEFKELTDAGEFFSLQSWLPSWNFECRQRMKRDIWFREIWILGDAIGLGYLLKYLLRYLVRYLMFWQDWIEWDLGGEICLSLTLREVLITDKEYHHYDTLPF